MTVKTDAAPNLLFLTLGFGAAFNVFGWLGNNLLLGDLWDEAGRLTLAGFVPPWAPFIKEAVTLVSDFVYAFALVWLFSTSREKSVFQAARIAIVVWGIGVALLYLTLVNAGFLPVTVAAASSALALAIFLAAAPCLKFLIRH